MIVACLEIARQFWFHTVKHNLQPPRPNGRGFNAEPLLVFSFVLSLSMDTCPLGLLIETARLGLA